MNGSSEQSYRHCMLSGIWYIIHIRGVWANRNVANRELFAEELEYLSKNYLVEEYGKQLLSYFTKHPVTASSNVNEYLRRLHNSINERLGKPLMSPEMYHYLYCQGNFKSTCKSCMSKETEKTKIAPVKVYFNTTEEEKPTEEKCMLSGIWFYLHMRGIWANQNRETRERFAEELDYISKNFPCEKCTPHFQKYLKDNPVRNAHNVNEYLREFHNSVNRRLGKPEMSTQMYYYMYNQRGYKRSCISCFGEEQIKPVEVKLE